MGSPSVAPAGVCLCGSDCSASVAIASLVLVKCGLWARSRCLTLSLCALCSLLSPLSPFYSFISISSAAPLGFAADQRASAFCLCFVPRLEHSTTCTPYSALCALATAFYPCLLWAHLLLPLHSLAPFAAFTRRDGTRRTGTAPTLNSQTSASSHVCCSPVVSRLASHPSRFRIQYTSKRIMFDSHNRFTLSISQ